MKLLILDNYDSFTYNLVHLIEKVSPISFEVIRNDKIQLNDVDRFDKILLSPGPGLPKNAGIMPELITKYSASKNIFGVCLGLQAIGEAFGGTLKNLEEVAHGLSTPIKIIDKDILFKNCPVNFKVGRYHSWVLDELTLPSTLKVTAIDVKGNVMAIKHETLNVRAVQFHPESILSEYGEVILHNWLNS